MTVELRELGYRAQAARSDARTDGRSILIVAGEVHLLDDKREGPLTIGSMSDRDLRFEIAGVSRDHARLQCFGRRWVLDDNSLNGTYVRRVGETRPWHVHHARFDLQHKDTFRCARSPWMLFENYDPRRTLRVKPEPDVAGSASLHDLTDREAEVASAYIARWFDGEDSSNAALASALFVSIETVKTHIANIRAKWGCRSREDIARRAVEAGLLPDRPARE